MVGSSRSNSPESDSTSSLGSIGEKDDLIDATNQNSPSTVSNSPPPITNVSAAIASPKSPTSYDSDDYELIEYPSPSRAAAKRKVSNEGDLYLRVEVTNPVRVNDSSLSGWHVEYTICTETNLPAYQKHKMPSYVSRRYEEFRWLSKALKSNWGIFVPPLPPKKSMLATLTDKSFDAHRLEGLKRFLDVVTGHVVMRETTPLINFLVSDLCLIEPKPIVQKLATNMLEFLPLRTDGEAELTTSLLSKLEEHLSDAEKNLKKTLKDLDETVEQMTSSTERCDELLKRTESADSFQPFSYLSEFILKVLNMEYGNLQNMMEVVTFYKLKVESVKGSFEIQDSKRQKIGLLNKTLEERRNQQERPQDGLSDVYAQKDSGEVMNELQVHQNSYDKALDSMKGEFKLFRSQSLTELRSSLKSLLKKQDDTCSAMKKWLESLPE